VDAVRTDLLPLTDLVTPNVPEAAVLLDVPPATDVDQLPGQATALLGLGPRAVLLKGGHLGGVESVDVLATADGVTVTRRPRVDTTSTHGTGLHAVLRARRAGRAGRTDDWDPAGRPRPRLPAAGAGRRREPGCRLGPRPRAPLRRHLGAARVDHRLGCPHRRGGAGWR
jgi:hydroxymethylpyrimidine/phosphomethylpyrimidine kinase